MCQFLLEKASDIGKHDKESSDLFVHCVLTYFEVESAKSKKAIQDLMTLICHQSPAESKVHHLVMNWLGDADNVINVGIGAKVMSMLLNAQDNAFLASKNKNFLQRPLQLLDEDDFGPQYGVAITYLLELLQSLLLADNINASQVNLSRLSELIIHPCFNVRLQAVNFFATAFHGHSQKLPVNKDLHKQVSVVGKYQTLSKYFSAAKAFKLLFQWCCCCAYKKSIADFNLQQVNSLAGSIFPIIDLHNHFSYRWLPTCTL